MDSREDIKESGQDSMNKVEQIMKITANFLRKEEEDDLSEQDRIDLR